MYTYSLSSSLIVTTYLSTNDHTIIVCHLAVSSNSVYTSSIHQVKDLDRHMLDIG